MHLNNIFPNTKQIIWPKNNFCVTMSITNLDLPAYVYLLNKTARKDRKPLGMTCREKLVFALNNARKFLYRQRIKSQPSASKVQTWFLTCSSASRPSHLIKGVSDMVATLKAQSTPLLGAETNSVSLIQFNMIYYVPITHPALSWALGATKDIKKLACRSLHYTQAGIRE